MTQGKFYFELLMKISSLHFKIISRHGETIKLM